MYTGNFKADPEVYKFTITLFSELVLLGYGISFVIVMATEMYCLIET